MKYYNNLFMINREIKSCDNFNKFFKNEFICMTYIKRLFYQL